MGLLRHCPLAERFCESLPSQGPSLLARSVVKILVLFNSKREKWKCPTSEPMFFLRRRGAFWLVESPVVFSGVCPRDHFPSSYPARPYPLGRQPLPWGGSVFRPWDRQRLGRSPSTGVGRVTPAVGNC
ncbi:hypothetical protein EMIT0P100_50186 [Pseudomonas sp. IT-P100]